MENSEPLLLPLDDLLEDPFDSDFSADWPAVILLATADDATLFASDCADAAACCACDTAACATADPAASRSLFLLITLNAKLTLLPPEPLDSFDDCELEDELDDELLELEEVVVVVVVGDATTVGDADTVPTVFVVVVVVTTGTGSLVVVAVVIELVGVSVVNVVVVVVVVGGCKLAKYLVIASA